MSTYDHPMMNNKVIFQSINTINLSTGASVRVALGQRDVVDITYVSLSFQIDMTPEVPLYRRPGRNE